MEAVDIDGDAHCVFVRTPVVYFHIVAPEEWQVLPFVAVRKEAFGIVMKLTGPAVPLVKYMLTTKNCNMLNEKDLRRLRDHSSLLNGDNDRIPTAEEMLELLAGHCSCSATEFVSKFKDTADDPDCLHEDPFAAAVYNNLDPEDKLEFPEVGDVIKKKRLKRARAAVKRANPGFADRNAKRARGGRGRGRGGPKGRGRGGGRGPPEAQAAGPPAPPPPPPPLPPPLR